MKFKNAPKVFLPETVKQKFARKNKIQSAIQITELHKYYIESGAQFKMTFSEFKRKHKGKKNEYSR
jgi:biopolymer transport protein ExbD